MGSPKRWPPELNEDVTGEILLRIPPDEPEHLIRASVVCKLWLRIVSDPAFLRRYAAFHRGAPLLGFFYNLSSLRPFFPGFVPTTAASLPEGHGCRARWAVDCCHGRVLLRLRDMASADFVVWDPFSNHCDELPAPWSLQAPGFCYFYPSQSRCNAVVFCAVAGCDHSSCRGGPFHVVCVGVHSYGVYTIVHAHVYSSQSRSSCTPPSEQFDCIKYFDTVRGGLIGDGVYFTANQGYQATRIVKYDLVKHRLSTISVPQYPYRNFTFMQNEDGSLGIAGLLGSTLCIWSTMVNAEGVTGWLQRRVIILEEILPAITTSVLADVISFAEGVEVFFISTNVGAFTFDLKSGRVTKVGEPRDYKGVTPFISFITPGRAFAANRQRKHYITQIKNGSI